MSGPFTGLSKHESAIEVTTIVQEQFNALETLKERGALPNSVLPGVNEELRRRSLDTVGVLDALYSGWNRKCVTEECFKEVVDSTSLGLRRSDLTDSKSMQLYCSFFDDSISLTNYEMNTISGGKEKLDTTLPKGVASESDVRKESRRRELLNMTKAKMMGLKKSFNAKSPALFPNEELKKIPRGYEQINDDLFARKDNRFMVFNGAGLETSWPPKPSSKISSDSLISDITLTITVNKK